MKETIEHILEEALGAEYAPGTVEAQPRPEFGHYTTPIALRLAKQAEMNPRVVAENVKERLENAAPAGFFERVEIAGPGFVNLWIASDAIRNEFLRVSKEAPGQECRATGQGQKAIVEYSQPNIAKEMHTGHLRNTILGDAIANVHAFLGYEVIRWNYLGDWGTQFGKMIAAWKMWGSEDILKEHPIEALQALYVRFNAAAKEDEALAARGREESLKLEEGDPENRALWELFKKESLREIGEVYDLLKVQFDTFIGESFFESKMKPLVTELLEKGVAERSEGAVIVSLEDEHLPPALIQRADGASLYITRDIAALEYRVQEYHPEKLLYVVGNEQTLHFSQLLAVAKRLGLLGATEATHVKYGLLLAESGKKMSTREGTSVSVKELIQKAVDLARAVVEEKNAELSSEEKDTIGRVVGVGALKYFMLRENRLSDIVFDWVKMLDFKGDSGPYLQYTYARLERLIAKAGEVGEPDMSELTADRELTVMRKLFEFPDEVRRSAELLAVNNIANYLYELAVVANRFYEGEQILADGNHGRRAARLLLARTAARVIAEGLRLLGIEVLEAI